MGPHFKIPLKHLIAISISGLGIGFLVGLSASPVVNGLIAGIVSLAAGIVSALCGVRLETSKPSEASGAENQNLDVASQSSDSGSTTRVTPVPIAFLVVSIVLGSILGIGARTQEWFAESPDHLAEKWQKSTGLSKEIIAQRLFNAIYGFSKGGLKSEETKSEEPKSEEPKITLAAGVLFSVPEDKCKRLRVVNSNDLRLELEGLGYANIKEFATRCKDDEDVKLAVDWLICPEKGQ
jgi:hypothetical protein